MPLRTASIALAMLLAAASSHADTYPRQPGIDAIHYVFRLSLDDTSNQIAGEATVTLRIVEPINELALDLDVRGGR